MVLRRALNMLCTLLLCVSVSACATNEPLRIESQVSQGTSAAQPPLPTARDDQTWEQPFTPAQVRPVLLAFDLGAVSTQENSEADIREYLTECDKCLVAMPAYETAGEKFQIYNVITAGDAFSFASFAIRDANGKPEVALAVGGSDVSLSAGKEGSLVAQEAIYEPDDPMCCPSGWSVRMFRYQDGQFIQGDSFSSPVDPAQDQGTEQ